MAFSIGKSAANSQEKVDGWSVARLANWSTHSTRATDRVRGLILSCVENVAQGNKV